MYKTHKDCLSAWVLMEIISFGELIDFFEFYLRHKNSQDFKKSSLKGLLSSARRIRNSSAHNVPILFGLSKNELSNNSKYIYMIFVRIKE